LLVISAASVFFVAVVVAGVYVSVGFVSMIQNGRSTLSSILCVFWKEIWYYVVTLKILYHA